MIDVDLELLVNDEIVKSVKKEFRDLEYFYLTMQNEISWIALNDYVDGVPNYNKFIYECPYLKSNKYFWVLPIAIMSNDIQKYKALCSLPDWRKDMMFDFKWIKETSSIEEYMEYENSLSQSFMGHGYTDFTLPSDGYGNRELITIKLDNGDYVLAISHIWYNK